jgi:hypothetical protein
VRGVRAPLLLSMLSAVLLAVPARAEAPTRVQVIKAERWISERGEQVVSRDSSMRPLVVWVRSPGGQWRTIFGKNTREANLVIDDVPPGPIIVRDGRDYVATSARSFDFTLTHLGRPDLQRARLPTPFAVNLTGLQPWQKSDRVVFFAPSARSYESNVQNKLFATLAPGATRLVASGDYLSFRGASLVDGPGHGDEAWFLDMATTSSPEGVRYLTTRKALRTTKLKLTSGQPASVGGKLEDVRQNQKTLMDWQIDDPAALARAVSPEARATGGAWQIVALPGGDRFGGHDFGGTLVYVPIEPLHTPPRASLTYGDPFPGSWGRVRSVRLTYSIPVPVLGTREPFPLEVSLGVGDSPAASAGPLHPRLTPVRDPRINGRPAFEPQARVTGTPELSWTPPAVGHPTLYELLVYRTRMNRERKADLQLMARLYTADTRLAFPPGIIINAEVYVLVIQAHQAEGLDPQHPWQEPLHAANAPCVTALFSP